MTECGFVCQLADQAKGLALDTASIFRQGITRDIEDKFLPNDSFDDGEPVFNLTFQDQQAAVREKVQKESLNGIVIIALIFGAVALAKG